MDRQIGSPYICMHVHRPMSVTQLHVQAGWTQRYNAFKKSGCLVQNWERNMPENNTGSNGKGCMHFRESPKLFMCIS